MKHVYLISALFTVAASVAVAQTVDFATVDTNQDGIINVSELAVAMPELVVADTNGDDILSEEEAEAAIEGLVLEEEAEGDDNATVGEADFALMLEALNSSD